jgi:hypothetical protein
MSGCTVALATGVAVDSKRTRLDPQQDCGAAESPQLPFMPSQQEFALVNDSTLKAKLKLGATKSARANNEIRAFLIAGGNSTGNMSCRTLDGYGLGF